MPHHCLNQPFLHKIWLPQGPPHHLPRNTIKCLLLVNKSKTIFLARWFSIICRTRKMGHVIRCSFLWHDTKLHLTHMHLRSYSHLHHVPLSSEIVPVARRTWTNGQIRMGLSFLWGVTLWCCSPTILLPCQHFQSQTRLLMDQLPPCLGGLQCLHNFSLQDDVTLPPLPSHIPPSQTISTFTNFSMYFLHTSFISSFIPLCSSLWFILTLHTACGAYILLVLHYLHCNPESVTSAPQLVCNLIISIINTKYNITVT